MIDNLVEYLQDNTICSSLKFTGVFPVKGKQGVAGVLKQDNGDMVVFKMSNYIDYLIRHETLILKGLQNCAKWLPHIPMYKGRLDNVPCNIKNSIRDKNPFRKGTNSITKELYLSEYIPNKTNLYTFIHDYIEHTDVIFSCVKQVLLSLIVLQEKKQFTHYDLHPMNILIYNNPNKVTDWFIYKFSSEKHYAIPVNGRIPKIIDFGYSYSSDVKGNPLWCNMSHTQYGFTTCNFDWITDIKILLTTVSKELMNSHRRHEEKVKRFNNLVSSLLFPLQIDKNSGWDKIPSHVDKNGASENILSEIESWNISGMRKSKLWERWNFICFDIIQSLIIHPLGHSKFYEKDVHKSLYMFFNEWNKIENQITSTHLQLFMFKEIVDITRNKRCLYTNDNHRKRAVSEFKKDVTQWVDKQFKWFNVKDIDWEKLMCSLCIISRFIETRLYQTIKKVEVVKTEKYKELPFNDLYELYEIIESEIPYNSFCEGDTMVDIIDVEKECKSSHLVTISNEIQKTPNLIKSNMILKSIKSKSSHHCF